MQQQGERPSNYLVGSHAESAALFNKEKVVLKKERSVKMCHHELSHYVTLQFGYIDPDFQHVLGSISYQHLHPSQTVQWVPAEELVPATTYSQGIAGLDELQFSKKSISYALLVIHWFAKDIFEQLFIRRLSQIHLYTYDLMINGIFVQLPIDSYVPVDPPTKRPLFANHHHGALFPCLFEKMLAKVYGDYCSITGEFIDIVEMVTFYCRQEVSCTQGITEVQLLQLISRKLAAKSVVCFRTRNSIRLESFGLESNQVYIILGVIEREQGPLVQFLQLQGVSWVGKWSKLRSSWSCEQDFVREKGVLLGEQERENYMSLADLRGIAREVVILNNSSLYHKNYLVCSRTQSLCVYQFTLDKSNAVMLRTSFKHKKCYNTIILARLDSALPHSYKLIASSFSENKSCNYLQAQLSPGTYFILVYNTHPQEEVLPYNLTVFCSQTYADLKPSQHEAMTVLQGTFLNHFREAYFSSPEPVIVKHLYQATGMAFVLIKPVSGAVEVVLQMELLRQSRIFGLNLGQQGGEWGRVFGGKEWRLLCFACHWSKKENIAFELEKAEEKWQEKLVFPPAGSLKVIRKRPL